jgi:hypothetical protein
LFGIDVAVAEAQTFVTRLCGLLTPWLLAQEDPAKALTFLQDQPFSAQGWLIPEEVLQQCAGKRGPS